jgi:hypothetical protein
MSNDFKSTRGPEAPQHPKVPLVISRTVYRRFTDKRNGPQLGVTNDPAESLNTNRSLANVLMPVSM